MPSSLLVVVELTLASDGDFAVAASPGAFQHPLFLRLVMFGLVVSFTGHGGIQKDAAQLAL